MTNAAGWGFGLIALLLLAASPAAAARSSTPASSRAGLDAFVRTYHCPLLEALETIRAHPMTPRDRYIVLAVDPGQRYVQCRFLDEDRQIECEAASGFYGPRPRRGPSTAQRRAIAAQGFAMDGRQGNFRLVRRIADRSDLWAVTDLMLETLYRGYGARLRRPIAMNAPFAPGGTLPRGDGACIPVS